MEKRAKKSAGQSGTDGNSELRIKRMEFYVSPSELERINKSRERSGHATLARFIRAQVLGSPKGQKSTAKSNSEFAAIAYELSRIGNNLNQIAKRVNASKSDYFGLTADLGSELESLRRLNRKNRLVKIQPEE